MDRAPYYPNPNIDSELEFTMGTPAAPLFAAMVEHAQKHGVTPFPMRDRPFCFITTSGRHETFASASFEEVSNRMTRVRVHLSALSRDEEEESDGISPGTQEALNAWKRELTLVAHHIDARPALRKEAETRYLSASRSYVDHSQFPFHLAATALSAACTGLAINTDPASIRLAFMEMARMHGVQLFASRDGRDRVTWLARSDEEITVGTAFFTRQGNNTYVALEHRLYRFDAAGCADTAAPSGLMDREDLRGLSSKPWSEFLTKLTNHARLMQSPYPGLGQ